MDDVANGTHPRGRALGTGDSPDVTVLTGQAGHAGRMIAMLHVGSIVIRVDDLSRQREFWAAALDYVPREETSDDFALLSPRDGVGPNLSLDQVRSTVQVPPRIHLDLYAEDQAAEVRRLIGLGATEVHWDKRPPDADYIILADPEGNRFCVIDGGETGS
jgi:catechol-2,3-dioxygenase